MDEELEWIIDHPTRDRARTAAWLNEFPGPWRATAAHALANVLRDDAIYGWVHFLRRPYERVYGSWLPMLGGIVPAVFYIPTTIVVDLLIHAVAPPGSGGPGSGLLLQAVIMLGFIALAIFSIAINRGRLQEAKHLKAYANQVEVILGYQPDALDLNDRQAWEFLHSYAKPTR